MKTIKQEKENLLNSGNIIYDVCSDYSLDLANDRSIKAFMIDDYKVNTITAVGCKLRIYTHIKYDEIHYVIAKKGLTGLVI